jgi:epoxyqueuosine reductase
MGSAADSDRLIRDKVRALGFEVMGVAAASEPIELDFARYEAFVDSGKAGTMTYLTEAREARRRLDTDAILEGARSVICVAERYAGPAAVEGTASGIARYARGRDYHNHLRRRLRRLAAFLRTLGEGVRARPLCDDAPVLERAWAARAGLGFVGKNGLLIVPGVGSFVLLGEVVTTLELPAGVPMAERCGSCTLCLDACPTGAFDAPFVLDPRKCISYWTIEHRGETPAELRPFIGEHLFGCDVCQDVCPYNRAAVAPSGERGRAPSGPRARLAGDGPRARLAGDVRAQYAPLPVWSEISLDELIELTEEAFHTRLEGSPVRRATRAGLSRNAVTVLANRRDPRYRALFERVARGHPDAVVREHAQWALDQLASHHDPKVASTENR